MNAAKNCDNWFWELLLRCPLASADPLTCFLFEIGATGTEEIFESDSQITLKVYFNGGKFDPVNSVRSIAADLGLAAQVEIVSAIKRKAENWQANWKAHFKSIEIGKNFCVRPPWSSAKLHKKQIVIQPGFGFGTGYHESTHLALQLLEQVAEFHSFQSVLDVGTGSGILSIGALLLGAREVYAIDIDSDAVNEVKSNLELSGLDANHCSVEVGDVAGLIRAPSDLVMANIEDHILIGLADDLLRLTKPGGVLLLSGILTERKLELLSKLGSRIEQVSQLELNEWTGLTLKKPELLAVTNQ